MSPTAAPASSRITIPTKPLRSYVRRVFERRAQGCRRFCLAWARRTLKTTSSMNMLAKEAMTRRGQYAFIAPSLVMVRRGPVDGLDHEGNRLLTEVFPPSIIRAFSEGEMRLELTNGSVVMFLGADRPDTLRGPRWDGVVLDEYSVFESPEVLTVILPILAESNGWLMVLSTPLGQNHFAQLYNVARANPTEWYVEKLTVDDVRRDAEGEDGGPVVSHDEIEAARRDGMDEPTIQQEFFCSFSGPVSGSVWGKELEAADAQGRIGRTPYDPGHRVDTWWDIGVHDDTAIILTQSVGKAVHVIDYVEGRGEGLAYYVRELEKRPYVWGEHVGPPDLAVREFGTGKTRLEQARGLGIKFRVVPQLPVVDGLSAARVLLAKCYFDETQCRVLLQHLAGYRREFSPRLGTFGAPRHDLHSHGADAFRYLAVGYRERREDMDRRQATTYAASATASSWKQFMSRGRS